MLKPGDDVDSWCGVCKLILAHTIEAMVDDTPARVHCNTCRAQHRYKPYEPGKAPTKTVRKGTAARRPQTRKARATQYQKLLNGQDVSLAKRYSPADSYAQGDVVEHARFGLGVTTTIKAGDKIEVVFEDGVKTLVHQR